MDKKRLIFAIVFVLVSIAIGYLLYRVFFVTKEDTTYTTPPTGSGTIGGLFPSAGQDEGERETISETGQLPESEYIPYEEESTADHLTSYKINTLVSAPIINPVLTNNGNANFYNQSDGKFYKIDSSGNTQTLSDEIFYNVENVTWSPKDDKAIIEYPDGSNIYYNFDTRKQVSLPKHWEEFSFAKTGAEIVSKSIGLSESNRWLISSDPEGKNVKLIEPMGENADKVIVDWSPNQQVVALSRTGDVLGAYQEEVLFVGQNGENFKSMVVEGRDLRLAWSPTGNRMLYSVYSDRSGFKPELWIVDAEGENIGNNRKSLGINTWADKCTWKDERYIYCAVPEELNTGVGFAPELADYTQDLLYKIDTKTGIKTEITLNDYHVINTMFIDQNNTLFFTDKNQTGLFTISI